MSTSNWGIVEKSIVAKLSQALVPDWTRTVKSARSEGRADEEPKGYNSIYVISHGSRSSDSPRSNSGYLRQDLVWSCSVLLYTQSGKFDDDAAYGPTGLYSLDVAVRDALLAYTPAGQQENGDCLRLRGDAQVEEYYTSQGTVSLKLKQDYVLKHLVSALVQAAVAA